MLTTSLLAQSNTMENVSATAPVVAGLDSLEASRRLRRDGPNELPGNSRRAIWRIAADVLKEPMFTLLLLAAALYLMLGDLVEAVVLSLFATVSVGIAVVQEGRTENILASLRNLSSPRALVIRDGRRVRVPGRDVVVGDVVVLSEGDRVPADSSILFAHDLLVDESLLTGESVPVSKETIAAPDIVSGLPLAYSGSLIVRGSAVARVVATGPRSEIGKIGQAVSEIELEPPLLHAQTRRAVRWFAAGALLISFIAFVLYGLLRASWLNALLSGIALGMSMLPEEFPLVLTVFMVMGAWRISRTRVLTRRTSAIETLGAATVLCTDKTGTLTENKMTVTALETVDDSWNRDKPDLWSPSLHELIRIASMASAVESLDPMERAIHDLAVSSGASSFPGAVLLRTYGLRPDLLAVTNVWGVTGGVSPTACTKGAPEAIARLCCMRSSETEVLEEKVDRLAAVGVRVLGVATAAVDPAALPDDPREFSFVFRGLVGLVDPLRSTVPAAVGECHNAGIRVIMITGDYPLTAKAIAGEAGIDSERVINGSILAGLSTEELAVAVRQTCVFARISPTQKLRIVEALKSDGEVVAMTGDGVNDAPALKAAHIGIAMGGRGTDVAREAAGIVLLDDDFASIERAVRLGRRIYDNLQKAMEFIVAVHVPIAGLAMLPLVFNLPLILWPVHIALLELFIDPVCSIVFEAQPEEADVMRRQPRPRSAQLLSPRLIGAGILQGVIVLAGLVAVFFWIRSQKSSEVEVRALLFTTLILSNIILVFANRAFDNTLAGLLQGANKSLWIAATIACSGLGIALFVPAVRAFLHFGTLQGDDLTIATLVALTILLILEGVKPIWSSKGRSIRAA